MLSQVCRKCSITYFDTFQVLYNIPGPKRKEWPYHSVSSWENQSHSGYFRHRKFNTEIDSSRSTPLPSSYWKSKRKVVLPGCTNIACARLPSTPAATTALQEIWNLLSHQHTEPTHLISARAEPSSALHPLSLQSVTSIHPYPILVRKCSQEEK